MLKNKLRFGAFVTIGLVASLSGLAIAQDDWGDYVCIHIPSDATKLINHGCEGTDVDHNNPTCHGCGLHKSMDILDYSNFEIHEYEGGGGNDIPQRQVSYWPEVPCIYGPLCVTTTVEQAACTEQNGAWACTTASGSCSGVAAGIPDISYAQDIDIGCPD